MIDAIGRPQSVLVLGGSSEIAQAIVAKLVPTRCKTVILAGRDGPRLLAAAEAAAQAGADTIETVDFDATDIAQHAPVVDRLFEQFGDIDVVVASAENVPAAVERLASLGYWHEGDLGIEGREAFTAPAGLAEHHLYVLAVDTPELTRHRMFRDYLRSHPDEVQAYAELKRDLADQFAHDREAYTEGKGAFVNSRLNRAGWNG